MVALGSAKGGGVYIFYTRLDPAIVLGAGKRLAPRRPLVHWSIRMRSSGCLAKVC